MLRKAKPPEFADHSILLLRMQDSNKPSRWPETDTFGQALGERDINKFVKSCPVCQRVKINKQEHVKQGSFSTEKTCFKMVHVDLVGLFPEASCTSRQQWTGPPAS